MPESVSTPTLSEHVERLEAIPSTLLASGEKLYSPAGAAKACRVPGHRGGPHLNGSTVWRFINKGKRVNGKLIRCEAVRAGDRWLTSVESLERFFARLTEAALPSDDTPTPAPAPTPKQRSNAAKAASKCADELFGAASGGK